MPQHAFPGRHRAEGFWRQITLRPTPARHSLGEQWYLRVGFGIAIGSLAVADSVIGGLLLHHHPDDNLVASPRLPAITIPPPSTAVPSSPPPQRGERRQAKVRPPVMLGPEYLATSLTAYCQSKVDGGVGASATSSGWRCDSQDISPVEIDMDAACRWLFGTEAWAGMLDDDDQQTWRCYQDPS